MTTALLSTLLLAIAALQSTTKPADPVTITIDATRDVGPISPYIYGTNQVIGDPRRFTLFRQGGNRMTAYNWENNASNAGSDWQHQSDDFLGGGGTPGEVARKAAEAALSKGKVFVATIPMTDYVAADKNAGGDVNKSGPDYLAKRFHQNRPSKGVPPAIPPDTTDKFVYQDEFVAFLEKTFQAEQQQPGADIWYSLDNEPDLWSHTHARIHPEKVTYAEMVDRTERWAKAIKDVAPDAPVLGFVSYGWNGYTTLQNAPDANGRDFIDFFLGEMRKLEQKHGKRLVDVLDLHYYTEARGGGGEQDGVRVSDRGPRSAEPAVAATRVNATRSLWDPTYTEVSWITRVIKEPIQLLPRLRAKIDKHYPGTKLAITEYNFGGGHHISGAVAQADALGTFGREGLYAAAFWSLQEDNAFIGAAFDAFRNYDGNGGTFGDVALAVDNTDPAAIGAYASRYSDMSPGGVLVLTNRGDAERTVNLKVHGGGPVNARVFRIAGIEPKMKPAGTLELTDGAGTIKLPPMSVTTIAAE
jgi:hypothetical protein